MLSTIRERATGWVLWIIAIIVIIPFAFWGLGDYVGEPDTTVAVVEGEEIDQYLYRRELDQRRNALRRVLGDQFDADLVNSMEFRRGVLEDLIARNLLLTNATDSGYAVGDRMLAELIRTYPQFQIDGRFSADAYGGYIRSRGMSEAGFEAQLRQQTVVDQVRTGLEATAFVPSAEMERMSRLLAKRYHFDYMLLDALDFSERMEPSEQDVIQAYEQNGERYRLPEQVRVAYVMLAVDQLEQEASVSDEELQEAFEGERNRFTTAASRSARHILIAVNDEADDTTQAEARERAQDLLQRIESGEDFAALAEEFSDDPGSAANGGDLGEVEPGDMVQTFEDALFDLTEVGQVAGPVKTRFGYHLIELTDYSPAQVEGFDAVREDLERELVRQQAESMFLERASDFKNISYEQPESLEPVAEALGLEIRETDWFSRGSGDGITANREVREVAFSDDVFLDDLNSEALELDLNTLVVIRKLETKPAETRPLEEVREQIIGDLQLSQATSRIAELGPQLVTDLAENGDWIGIAEENGLERNAATISRLDPQSGAPASLATAVFASTRPASGEPVYGGVSLGDGSYGLFRLTEVEDGDVADLSDTQREAVEAVLQQRAGMDVYLSYQTDLRQKAEVQIFDEHL